MPTPPLQILLNHILGIAPRKPVPETWGSFFPIFWSRTPHHCLFVHLKSEPIKFHLNRTNWNFFNDFFRSGKTLSKRRHQRLERLNREFSYFIWIFKENGCNITHVSANTISTLQFLAKRFIPSARNRKRVQGLLDPLRPTLAARLQI